MDAVYDGKIEVEPFVLDTVLELRVKETLNEHATFYLLARLEKEQAEKPLKDVGNETKIKFKSDGSVIFSGITKNISITCIDEVYYLRVLAVSHTARLDVAKKRRSFQDDDMSYRQIIEKVTKEKGSRVTFGNDPAANDTVYKIILQYEETDWEFCKRLASQSHDVLIPKIKEDTPDFICGVKETESKGDLESYNYSVSKNLSFYRKMTASYSFLEEADTVSYTITSNDKIFNLGDMLTLDKKPLYISAVNLMFTESVLKCTYALSPKKALSVPEIYHDNIIGLRLYGEVLAVKDDTVRVRLNIDKDDNGHNEDNSTAFKYETPYHNNKNTGWYVMPEKGDYVNLVFPTNVDHSAYAAPTRRPMLHDGDKAKNPRTKYLRTRDGKEIKFDKEEILITAKDKETFIKINEETGIEIITPHPIQIRSDDYIAMTSKDDIIISADENLFLKAGNAVYMTADDGNSEVSMDPEVGDVRIVTQLPIKMTSKEDDVLITSEANLKVHSKEFTLNGTKVAINGSVEVNLDGAGSTIKLSGGTIEQSAPIIKLN